MDESRIIAQRAEQSAREAIRRCNVLEKRMLTLEGILNNLSDPPEKKKPGRPAKDKE